MKPASSFNHRVGLRAGICALAIMAFPYAGSAQEPRQSQKPVAGEFDALLKVEPPIILCIDHKPTAGGQPSDQAYAKAAANGFRSVLTLRSRSDGVDLLRERFMVEKNQLRYFNLPVLATLPKQNQVDEFLALLRDKRNQPMLINCAFAERVAPYLMMFNLAERGWDEERAVEEASKSGLHRKSLQELARNYLKARAAHKAGQKVGR
jgi:protein tyrosine phosphatase (PTP) superfamily phosphohydrolase (DUF442 family)